MTIPTRPAPPPPKIYQNRNHENNLSHNMSSSSFTKPLMKKPAPPPRPPPPRILHSAPLKETECQKTSKIFSTFFGASKNTIKSYDKISKTSSVQKIFPKDPSPPTSHFKKNQSVQQVATRDIQLINFEESPTSSPPTVKKFNMRSDSVSMDSFSSSNSSPNNLGCSSGATSQAER